MTWSFFLAQIAVAAGLPGGGKAAQEDGSAADGSTAGSVPAFGEPPDLDASGVAASGDMQGDETSASPASIHVEKIGPLAGIPQHSTALAASNATTHAAPPAAGGGGAGGGGSGPARASASNPSDDPSDNPHDNPHDNSHDPSHGLPSASPPPDAPPAPSIELPDPGDLLPGTVIGAHGSVADLLGFDLRLGADGLFVGADIDLGQLHLDQVGSGLVEAVGSTLADLGHLLDVDVPGLGDLLGAGESLSQVGSTLADVTGLRLFDGAIGSSDQQHPESQLNASSALGEATDAVLDATSGVAYLVRAIVDLDTSSQDGAVTTGGTIAFPALASDAVALVDDLFNGGRYTEYGLALSAEATSGASAVRLPDGGTGDHAAASPASNPALADNHDSHHSTPDQHAIVALPVELPALFEDIDTRVL